MDERDNIILSFPEVPEHEPSDPPSDADEPPQTVFQLHFEYNYTTGDIDIVPEYPIMPPISKNLDDINFLDNSEPGRANLKIVNPDSSEFWLRNLNLDIIGGASSVLQTSFVKDHLTLYFPQTPVIALLRACYQGDYTFCEAMIHRPIPLLLHLQVLALGIRYRMPNLVDQAGSLAYDCMSVSSIMRPPDVQDVCASVKFVYTELRARFDLRQSISTYCVVNFVDLDGELFRQTAFESPAFHRDLQHANFRDLFSQPHAGEITQLAVCDHWIHDHDLPSWQGVNDFTCQFHCFEPNSRRKFWTDRTACNASAFQPASLVTTSLFNQFARNPTAESSRSGELNTQSNSPIRTRVTQSFSTRNLDNNPVSQSLPFRPLLNSFTRPESSTNDQNLQPPLRTIEDHNLPEDCSSGQPTSSMSDANLVDATYSGKVMYQEEHCEDAEDWHQVALNKPRSSSGTKSYEESIDSEWTTVDTPSENPASNAGDDYDFPHSDSEWSIVDQP